MEHSEQVDCELVRRVASRDRDALTDLYRRHGPVLFRHILFVVSDRGMSEEILQDTLVAVWLNAASFRGDSKVRSWMIAIARRKAHDRMRRRRPAVVAEYDLFERPDAAPGPELLALDRVEMADVATAVTMLRRGHREVLGLMFGAGLTLQKSPASSGSRKGRSRVA